MTTNGYYMPRLYEFLRQLSCNNNREWFKTHKSEYEELRELWMLDVDRLIALMSEWWPELAGLSAKQCVYRIYRDTRFSQDKTPLKTYFSAGFSATGRSAHDAGLYLQVGPGRFGESVDSGLFGGVWCPDSPTLRKLRKAIVDNIEEFEEIIHTPEMEEFYPGWCGAALKTVPKGYDRNHPQAELLRLKDYGKFHPTPESFYTDPSWVERTSELFSYLKPLIDFLDYSIKEEIY